MFIAFQSVVLIKPTVNIEGNAISTVHLVGPTKKKTARQACGSSKPCENLMDSKLATSH